MGKVLGLDLGSNSIGWAVIDDEQKSILGAGVRVFPEGVAEKGNSREESKNSQRRARRMARRQTFRRKIRKIKLLKTLIDYDMCPFTLDQLRAWKKGQGFPLSNKPDSGEIYNWLRMNPYKLRSKGLVENLTRMEFGRVIYHLIQRRGFKSGRKLSDTGAMFKGKEDKQDPASGIIGIDQSQKEMQGFDTYGSFLNHMKETGGRVRGRFMLRSEYVNEFGILWDKQAGQLGLDKKVVSIKQRRFIGNPDSYSNRRKITRLEKFGEEYTLVRKKSPCGTIDESYIEITRRIPLGEYLGDPEKGLLFFQHPLRSQKGLVSKCSLESYTILDKVKWITRGKKVSAVSHPVFELFRMHKFINNLEYNQGNRLTSKERVFLADFLKTTTKTKLTVADLKKQLELENFQFNYPDDTKVPLCYTISSSVNLLGKSLLSDTDKMELIWHDLYFYDDFELLYTKFINSYGLDQSEKLKNRLKSITLKEGYGRLSVKAMKNILPFLIDGEREAFAVILGGVKNVFGNSWANQNPKDIIDKISSVWSKEIDADKKLEEIKYFLVHDCSVIEKTLRKLYHPSRDIHHVDTESNLLSLPENIRNPIVQQALHETRRVVNAVTKQYLPNGERFDRIKVELARELKQAKSQRIQNTNRNKENERINGRARLRLDEYGLSHSRQNIHKYLLFEELERNGTAQCPYTGRTLSIADVLGSNNSVQIEHIIPFSVSLDDSLSNKTLCDSLENANKGELTPFQFYVGKEHDSEKWEQVKQRAFRLLPYRKAKKFVSEIDFKNEDFISRNLNDTRYISKAARELLLEICDDIQVFPGILTAELRHKWGLNTILSSIRNASSTKVRGECWAWEDSETKTMSYYLKRNSRPMLKPETVTVTGKISNGRFESGALDKMNSFDAGELPNGSCWGQFGVLDNSLTIFPRFNPMPVPGNNSCRIKGRIEKGRFSAPILGAKKISPSNDFSDGAYWFTVPFILPENHVSSGNDHPETKKDEIIYNGSVKEGAFKSAGISIPLNVSNGRWWLTVKPVFEEGVFKRIANKPPLLQENEILIEGRLENGMFVPNNAEASESSFSLKHEYEGVNVWGKFKLKKDQPVFTPIEREAPVNNNRSGTLMTGSIVDQSIDDSELTYFMPKKNREDHRHHAIDAITVACTERSYLQRLSTWNAYSEARKRGKAEKRPKFPAPWDGFRNNTMGTINKIIVSIRKNNRVVTNISKKVKKNGKVYTSLGMAVRGQLHKETVYGKRLTPGNENPTFHVRKHLSGLKTRKQIEKIVDRKIKEIIFNRLEVLEVDISKDFQSVPKNAFFEDGKPMIHLPNKNGPDVAVRKVRIKENLGNALCLKGGINQYVNPRNNHHILIYKDMNGELQENCVRFMEAAQRIQKGEKLYQVPGRCEKVAVLQENEMFILGLSMDEMAKLDSPEQLSPFIYRVQKISESYYTFRHHLASTIGNSREELSIQSFSRWKELSPTAITVTYLGGVEIKQ